jgi:hypothetical protein
MASSGFSWLSPGGASGSDGGLERTGRRSCNIEREAERL